MLDKYAEISDGLIEKNRILGITVSGMDDEGQIH